MDVKLKHICGLGGERRFVWGLEGADAHYRSR